MHTKSPNLLSILQVREHPLYHLINAKVNKDQGNVEEAIKTLQTAMTLANNQVGIRISITLIFNINFQIRLKFSKILHSFFVYF